MQNLWQDGAALALVALAAIYLVRRAWPSRSASAGSACGGGCAGCSATDDESGASNSELIPIERLLANGRQE